MSVELAGAPGEQVAVEVHDEPDLGRRPSPVLGRERVDGQPAHTEFQCALDRVEQRMLTCPVPVVAWQAALSSPAPVAVHDDRDVIRDAFGIDHDIGVGICHLAHRGTSSHALSDRPRWYCRKLLIRALTARRAR